MFSSRSGGWLATLFLSAALAAGCSSKTYTDMNFGKDAGVGFVPEVNDVGADADGADGAGDVAGTTAADSAAGVPDTGAPADAGADADEASAPDAAGGDSAEAAPDALDNS